MKDGTAEFKTVDARVAAIFDLIYPVGSVFATTGSAPELGKWEEIAQGRTLQGADSSHAAGSTVEAGLPNITGHFGSYNGTKFGYFNNNQGAFYGDENIGANTGVSYVVLDDLRKETKYGYSNPVKFNASRSSTIYGNSTTVQPPAYIVHFYRRIA